MALQGTQPAVPLALAPPPAAARPPARSSIEPVAADRWQWRIGLNAERKAKLDRLRGYLSHAIPDGDLERLFDQMLDDSLERHGKRLGFVEPERPRKPAPPKAPTPGMRAPIPLAVRRAVLKRDGYRCTWVGQNGERCPCTTRLEMDHLEPAAETGSSGVDDLTTRCRPHNQYRAKLRYGAEHVRRRMGEDRRAREARRIAKANRGPGTLCEPVAQWLAGAASLPSRIPIAPRREEDSPELAETDGAALGASALALRDPPKAATQARLERGRALRRSARDRGLATPPAPAAAARAPGAARRR